MGLKGLSLERLRGGCFRLQADSTECTQSGKQPEELWYTYDKLQGHKKIQEQNVRLPESIPESFVSTNLLGFVSIYRILFSS